MKKALLIAFHYPPVKGSSGVQRTLRYSSYLGKFGWEVQVLTVHPRAYVKTGQDELADIPAQVKVHRALALDARRHMSIAGRYPGFLAQPDPWNSWRFDGVRRGTSIMKHFKPDVIWSTYPIATAHTIGMRLAMKFSTPWVADFRDLLTHDDWPPDIRVRQHLQRLQLNIVTHATRCVFTTPGAQNYYRKTYPDQNADKFVCLPNGYDESSFSGKIPSSKPEIPQHLTLLHAGILYPSERDPLPFFEAISELKKRAEVDASTLTIRLRATGHDEYYRPILKRLEIDDVVELAPPLAYRDILDEMMDSEGLLIFQAENCNSQIPAKLYEYFRASRPILALTHAAGDTAKTIQQESAGVVCDITSKSDIAEGLLGFLQSIRSGQLRPMQREQIARFSRQNQSKDLSDLFESLITSS